METDRLNYVSEAAEILAGRAAPQGEVCQSWPILLVALIHIESWHPICARAEQISRRFMEHGTW